jgi:hypothetical protein
MGLRVPAALPREVGCDGLLQGLKEHELVGRHFWVAGNRRDGGRRSLGKIIAAGFDLTLHRATMFSTTNTCFYSVPTLKRFT